MKTYKCLFFLIIALLLFTGVFAMAEELEDFLDMDLEALLNAEVITASRRVQKIHEAPNAMSVITAEDIKRSGAVDLPDLFRMVPGIDVANVLGSSYGVSARGFNEKTAKRMLVMIDGRSVYTPFFGGVVWENEEVFLEDIKQIEVIRGPGATMWGANSVNGVINIITKDPEDDQGFMFTSRVGTKHSRGSIFRYSGSASEKLSFNLTGGYCEDQGTRGVNDYRRVPRATGRLKYKLSENSFLHFFAGVNEIESGMELTMNTPQLDGHIRSNYQMLRLQHQFSDISQLQLQIYRDYSEIHGDVKPLFIEYGKYDFEILHSFALGKNNNIVWGANYRTIEIDSSYLYPHDDHDNILGFFVQDEIKILDTLKFIAGVKFEKNSFCGGDWSPRGCILYSPWPDHHFRFSVSRAYRTPSFGEDSADMTTTLPYPLPPVPLLSVAGNKQLDPEKMTAFELGYRTTLFKKIGFNVELYYNELDRIIDYTRRPNIWPLYFRLDNCFNVIAMGIEVSADLAVTPWWTLTANYTYQEVENKKTDKDIEGTPRHKFNLGSGFTFENGFSLDVRAHFVDETKWSGSTGDVKIDDYLRLDIRVSQKLFNNKVELSLVGQNLTDKLHPETTDGIGTYETERLIYGQVTLRFK